MRHGRSSGSVAYEGRPGYVELKPLPQDPELDPEDGEDRLACVTVGGGSVAYEGFCDLSSPLSDVDALAAKRVDAKTKHFQLEDGWVALDVPRNYSEAMRHRRAPQLWQADGTEMHSQMETKSHYLVPRPAPGDETFIHTLGWVYDFSIRFQAQGWDCRR